MTLPTPQPPHFLDTNIWLYALIVGQDPVKSQRAKQLIVAHSATMIVSTQIINEVCVNLIRKESFTPVQTRELILDYYARYSVVEINQTIMVSATHLREQYHFAYWDSLVVARARLSGAVTLYSEDMHDGLIIDNCLTIVNPFTVPPSR